jgi:hypothetical protein
MGCYTYIHAHFPVVAFSESEREFLAELRRLLPSDDEWLRLPHKEQVRRREEVHKQLRIPGEADSWQFVRQRERGGSWFVRDGLNRLPSPPFPRLLNGFYDPFINAYGLSAVWQVAFTASTRWIDGSSIYQPLADSRRHFDEVFRNVWRLLDTEDDEVSELEKRAPPGSAVHRYLRCVLSLFRFRDYLDIQRQALSLDLPVGTVLELNLLDVVGYLASYENEAKRKLGAQFHARRDPNAGTEAKYLEVESGVISRADELLETLASVGKMDIDAISSNDILASATECDEDMEAWLYFRHPCNVAISQYVRDPG